MTIRYLHVMVRVLDLEASMAFYRLLGLKEIKRWENEAGRFTLVYLAAPGQEETPVELTWNWDGGRWIAVRQPPLWPSGL